MLLRAVALVLLTSSFAWTQAAPAGCANLPRTPRTNPDDSAGQKEKVGIKQRLKDQFSSGCANLLVTSCWGDGAQKTPDLPGTPETKDPVPTKSTSSQQPAQPSAQQDARKKPSDPLAFPEDQSERAQEAAHGSSSSSSSKKSSPDLAFPEEQSRRAAEAASGGVSSSKQPYAPPPPTDSGQMEVIEMKPYNPRQADKDLEVGDFYYKRGNYKAAISRYLEAVQLRPGSPSATFKLADAYEKDKKLEQAAIYYSEYLREYPKGKQNAEARSALQRLAPIVRANAAHLKQAEVSHDLQAGEMLLAQKNYPDAMQRFCDVAGVAPDNARAMFRLAQAQEATGDFASAYQNYQSYLKLDPDGPFAPAARRELARLGPQVQQGKATSPSADIHP